MFGYSFLSHNKIYLVAASCAAIAAKTCPCAGFGIYLEAGHFVGMERATQALILIGL
jgi:hypothetical protein